MEFQVILFLIFGVIALVRALSRNAQGQQPQAQGDRPNRRRQVQSDIDAFLAEVTQTSGNQSKRQASATPPARQSRPQRTRPPAQQRQQKHRKQQPPRRRQANPRPQPLRESTSRGESSAAERPLGSGISEHVDSYISQHVADHIDSSVDDYVEVDIVESVDRHLGDRSAEMPVTAEAIADSVSSAEEFRRLLSSKQGMRQAILLNEVLRRPRSLQR